MVEVVLTIQRRDWIEPFQIKASSIVAHLSLVPFWSEKARIKWHSDGDRNTAYFHRSAKIKQAYKKISTLRVDDTLITDQEQIAEHVISHFTNLFSNENVVNDNGIIEEVIPPLVTENINRLLTMLPSCDEIHNAMFAMNKDSAP